MNKPSDPCPLSRIAPPAPEAQAATPRGSFYTFGVKNRQRSSPPAWLSPLSGRSRGLMRTAAAFTALFATALAPTPASADQGDEGADEQPARPQGKKAAPDPTDAGLKKIQDAIAKLQAEKAAKEKALKEKEKAAKDKAPKEKGAKRELTLEEKAQRGVVVIERGGQPIALGAALAGDGRVLTALSPLGPGNDLEARFADGTTVRVKLGHHDRMWDLALLVPQTGKWSEGLTASPRDPVRQDATIKSYSASRGKQPGAVTMTLRGYRTLIGGDDKPLEGAIEIGSRVMPNDLGAPVIDEEGRVVAILGRGCAPVDGRPCTPVAFGIPITAVKSFLRAVPATAVPPPAWLGIQGVAEAGPVAKGVRITVVHPSSPADEAQLKGGDRDASDMILAVDGLPVTSPETLADAMRAHAVGEKVPLTIFSQGKYKQITVVLRAAPGSRPSASAAPANPAELPPLPDAPSSAPQGLRKPVRR